VRAAESGALVFEELGTPTRMEVLDVARRTAERVDRLLQKSTPEQPKALAAIVSARS
jgi:hypothetical protein